MNGFAVYTVGHPWVIPREGKARMPRPNRLRPFRSACYYYCRSSVRSIFCDWEGLETLVAKQYFRLHPNSLTAGLRRRYRVRLRERLGNSIPIALYGGTLDLERSARRVSIERPEDVVAIALVDLYLT